MRAVERRTAHSAVEEFVVVKVFADRMIGVMATGTSDGLVEMAGHANPRSDAAKFYACLPGACGDLAMAGGDGDLAAAGGDADRRRPF